MKEKIRNAYYWQNFIREEWRTYISILSLKIEAPHKNEGP